MSRGENVQAFRLSIELRFGKRDDAAADRPGMMQQVGLVPSAPAGAGRP
jgi:hypothetical protein